MTRMLYSGLVMNNKPNDPEEIIPGKSYSFWTDWKVNYWAGVAWILSLAGDALLHHYPEWPVVLRAIIALSPLLAALLWVRSFARWMRGMDELHRQIQMQACLFAATATLFLFMTLHPLFKAGVFQTVGLHTNWLWDFNAWWLKILVMTAFYILGSKIFNRRYK